MSRVDKRKKSGMELFQLFCRDGNHEGNAGDYVDVNFSKSYNKITVFQTFETIFLI